ncbi:MAG: hypothetical protein LBR73_05125 [Oscillospiraceae bacterium]|nr:hypothetical protein [Oscillospiraceae bacterium]
MSYLQKEVIALYGWVAFLDNLYVFGRRAVSFLFALLMGWTGLGLTPLEIAGPAAILGTARETKYDAEALLFGAYCYYGNNDNNLLAQYAVEAGLDFLCGVPANTAVLDAFEANGLAAFLQQVGVPSDAILDHPAVWGVDIKDEPRIAEFPTVLAAQAALEATGKPVTAFLNLMPPGCGADHYYEADTPDQNDAWYWGILGNFIPISSLNMHVINYQRYIGAYISTFDTDHVCYDGYPLKVDDDGTAYTESVWLRCLYDLANAAHGTGRNFWAIIQGSTGKFADKPQTADRVAGVSQQVYANLALGANKIIYACYKGGWFGSDYHMINDAGERTADYYAVQQVTQNAAPIQAVFSNYKWVGTYTENWHKCAGLEFDIPADLDADKQLPLATDDGLFIGRFDAKDGLGGKAFVITNQMPLESPRSANFTVYFESDATVYTDGQTLSYPAGEYNLTLSPGNGMFITLAA